MQHLQNTHDLRLPVWGPYTKKYLGISHLADPKRGWRFDLSLFPDWLLQLARPQAMRAVQTGDAPATLEPVLRRKGRDPVLHGVNHHGGEREEFRRFNPGLPNHRITQIAPLPSCRVAVALPSFPARVTLEPQNQAIEGWKWENGRCEVTIPAFEIHQMVVFYAA